MSKKVLKVKSKKGESYGASYSHSGYMFAYCSKIANNEVKQQSGFNSCREDLASCLFYDNGAIHTDRSRYIVRHVTSSKADKIEKWFGTKTKVGLRIVNIMEDRHGWPLTKMYDAGTQVRKLGSYDYGNPQQLTTFQKVLIGSSRWVRSPHMVSLYTLLFRLPTKVKRFDSIENYEDLEKACKKCGGASSGDAYYVANTFKFWDMLMANFAWMFAGSTSKDNFKRANYNNSEYNEGISKPCRFECYNKQINEKFVALAKNTGLKV